MQLTGTDLARPSEVEERAALGRCRRGDAQAFGAVVSKNMKPAYFTALGLAGNHADALDLSQETFVRAYRVMPRFDFQQRFFTWYYRILRNLCLNHLHQRARFRELDPPSESPTDEGIQTIIHDQADPVVLAEQSDLAKHIWRAVARLKPEEREVFVLLEVEECSYAEIAERLEIPQGTVMSRLFYARRHLKEMLNRLV